MKVIKKIVSSILMVLGSLLMTPIVLAFISAILIFTLGATLFCIAINMWED
jgi:hypothetical protein